MRCSRTLVLPGDLVGVQLLASSSLETLMKQQHEDTAQAKRPSHQPSHHLLSCLKQTSVLTVPAVVVLNNQRRPVSCMHGCAGSASFVS
jgi:hypothetical protein